MKRELDDENKSGGRLKNSTLMMGKVVIGLTEDEFEAIVLDCGELWLRLHFLRTERCIYTYLERSEINVSCSWWREKAVLNFNVSSRMGHYKS